MEKQHHLVSWESPSTTENLNLKLIPLPFTTRFCSASSTKVVVLSEDHEVYILTPNLSKVLTSLKISTLACNDDVLLMISIEGLTLSQGIDQSNTGILGIEGLTRLHEPTIIPCLQHIKAIGCSLGNDHAAIIDSTGKLYAWGSNSFDQIGKDSHLPETLEQASIFCVTKVICGPYCTVFSTGGGHLYSFGHIGKSASCPKTPRKRRNPFILPDLEHHYTVNFSVGTNFIVALSANGEAFAFDDCKYLIKVPMKNEISGICTCQESICCIDKKTSFLYEWMIKPEKEEECSLKGLNGKAYKIGPACIFNSNSSSMYATVSSETAGNFLFNANHELTLVEPDKTSSSPLGSNMMKRTTFSDLKKEFSLNIDLHFGTKTDSAEKIADGIRKILNRIFYEFRKDVIFNYSYKKAFIANNTAIAVKNSFVKIATAMANWAFNKLKAVGKKENGVGGDRIKTDMDLNQANKKILSKLVENIEKSSKKPAFNCLKLRILRQMDVAERFKVLIFMSHIAKLFQKQKALIFTLLLRDCLSKKIARSVLKSVNCILTEHLSRKINMLNNKSPKYHNKYYVLMKFGLIYQSLSEKVRTSALFKGLRAFKQQIRTFTCFTPNLFLQKDERTLAESFDKNLGSVSIFTNDSYINSLIQYKERKKLSLGIPEKAAARLALKKNFNEESLPSDRRHSMNLIRNSKISKTEPPKSLDLRKAYDLKLKKEKEQKIRGNKKKILKTGSLKERALKLVGAVKKVEEIFRVIVMKKKLVAVNMMISSFNSKPVFVEAWKTKMYVLALHKFAFIVKKVAKKRFLEIRHQY